jgi:cell division protein FtsQ
MPDGPASVSDTQPTAAGPAGDAPAGSFAGNSASAGSASRSAAAGNGSPGSSASWKRARAASRWRAAFFALGCAGILAAVGWALLGSRLLVVRVITVSGTRLVSSGQVIAAARVPAGTPLIRVDPAQVASRVQGIRQVASAQVSKDWPDGLSIRVHERAPVVAISMAGGGYDLVDHDGVIVTWARARPAALPLLATSTPGSRLRGDSGVAAASQVLGGLPRWLSRQVARVTVTGPGQVTLYLSGGQTVVWGDAGRAGVKARELAILMRGRARYFDVSAPGTVVTK